MSEVPLHSLIFTPPTRRALQGASSALTNAGEEGEKLSYGLTRLEQVRTTTSQKCAAVPRRARI